jgi:FkbM family methyltransferase
MVLKLKDNRFNLVARKYRYYFLSIYEVIRQFAPLSRVLSLFIGKKSQGGNIISLRNRQLSFKVRSAMDLWSVKETFIDRFYEKYGCPVMDGWIVMDIGGGIGDFSIFAAHSMPSNKVFSFEPYPGSYALLLENLNRNRITNVQAFQLAIWSSDGHLNLDTSTGEPVQFISRESGSDTADSKVKVPCISLQDMMARLEIPHIDLMKIDAEGAEYAILFNAPDAVLENIDRIVMEYHDAITEHTHADLTRFLQGKGYRVKSVENAVHPELGYLYAER